MNQIKYALTRYERVLRVEKVKYIIGIPASIRNKKDFAQEQIDGGNYLDFKVVDIPSSEILELEIGELKKVK